MKSKTVFSNWWTYVSAFIGIAGTVLAIVVIPGNVAIAYKWLILVGLVIVIGYIILLVGIHNLMNVAKGSQNIDVAECYQDEENITYFSVEPYAGVGYDRYVSIYYRKAKQQRLIGVGVVDNIIGDNNAIDYVSVKVLLELTSFEDIWEKIKANEKNALMSIKLTQAVLKTEARVEVM